MQRLLPREKTYGEAVYRDEENDRHGYHPPGVDNHEHRLLMFTDFGKAFIGACAPPMVRDRLSPVQLKPVDPARLLLVVGERESQAFHNQADILAAAWGPAHVTGPLIVSDCHHFSVCTAIADTAGPLFKEIVNIFKVS
jgi:hypothetical protein